MNTLIVYDSMYGNTEKIAGAIYEVVSKKGKAILTKVDGAKTSDLKTVDLLIIGTPTNGGRPTPAMQLFLDGISEKDIRNKKFATFDTRFSEKDSGFLLKKIVKFFGYPAPRISDILKSKGGKEVMVPEGFIVTGKAGPLKDGELQKAKLWAQSIIK